MVFKMTLLTLNSSLLYGEKTTIKRYFLQLAKNIILENNFVLLQGTKIPYTKIPYSFSVKFFSVAVFTTFSAVLEMRCQIVRLKMVLMFFLWSSFSVWWTSAATCVPNNQMGWNDGFVIKQGKFVSIHDIVNGEGIDTSYINQIEKNM